MRRRLLVPLLSGLAAVGPADAQTVPEVRDVYSSKQPSSRLGPAVTPQRVLDEGLARLEGARTVCYEARRDGAASVSGTVLLGRSGPGPFDRFRITLRVRTPGGADRFGVVGRDGRRVFVVDLGRKTVAEAERWEELGELAVLARDLLLPDLARTDPVPDREESSLVRFPSARTVGEELCYVVHFPQAATEEHLYVSLSLDDGLPRRVERIRSGPDGRPTCVTVDVSDLVLDPPPPAAAFEPFVPTGFERVDP